MTPILINELGIASFGIWTLAMSVIGLAGFVELGFGTACARFLAEYRAASDINALSETATTNVLLSLAIGLLLGGSLYIGSNWVASFFSRSPQMVGVVQIASIGLVGTLFRGGALAVPMAFQRYDLVAGLGALQTSLVWVAATAVARAGGDVAAVTTSSVLAIWVSVFLAISIGLWLLLRVGFKPRLSLLRARSLLSYSAVTSATSIGSQLFTSLDKVVVGAILGVSALSYYAILTNVASRLNQLAGLLWQPLMPLASALQSKHADAVLLAYFIRSTVAATIVNISLAVGLILAADPLLSLWLGARFSEVAGWPLRTLLMIYAIFSINAPGYHIANGIGAAWMNAATGLAGGTLTILFIVIVAPHYGLIGATTANAGYLVTLLIVIGVYRRLQLRRSLVVDNRADSGAGG